MEKSNVVPPTESARWAFVLLENGNILIQAPTGDTAEIGRSASFAEEFLFFMLAEEIIAGKWSEDAALGAGPDAAELAEAEKDVADAERYRMAMKLMLITAADERHIDTEIEQADQSALGLPTAPAAPAVACSSAPNRTRHEH